jgi:hypothetical protein
MQLAPKSQAELAREEAALRERFAALQGGGTASASAASSAAAEDALAARLAKLGPSQFPDLNDDAAQRPREDLEVQMALQTVIGLGGRGRPARRRVAALAGVVASPPSSSWGSRRGGAGEGLKK